MVNRYGSFYGRMIYMNSFIVSVGIFFVSCFVCFLAGSYVTWRIMREDDDK